MSKITIGTHEDGKPFTLPPDVVTSTLIVYGGKGMGKTNFGSVLVEEMSRAGLHWCALDPMGVWWGLRHSADGKGPGIECLILGGPHGDIPIEPTGGAIVADLVVDEDANVIVDFSRRANGEAWSIGEKVRFVRDFGRQLHRRQSGLVDGKRREPICVVMDEAARFIPQTLFKTEKENPEAECLSVWSAIAEEGRNFGIGVVFLTQRSARLNKSVAELADVMVAFRTIGPNSVGAIADWLGEHKLKKEIAPFVESLRSLPKGDALFVSPGWLEFEGLVHVRLRETFDSSATPKPGERARKVTGKAAKPDLGKYAERMRETIERAKENDPGELKKQLAALRKELASAQKAKPATAAMDGDKLQKLIDVHVSNGVGTRDRQWRAAIKPFRAAIVESAKALVADLQSLAFREPEDVAEPPKLGIGHVLAERPKVTERRTQPPVTRSSPSKANSNGDAPEGVSGPQLKLLKALAEAEGIGRDAISRTWLAFLAGVSPLSSGFEKNVSTLSSRGLIRYPGKGEVALTEEGRAVAPPSEVPVTTEEMLARIKQLISGPQAELFQILHDKHPYDLSREELAQLARVSEKSSGFEKNVSTLSSRELVTYPAPGRVRAADWVFLN